MKDFLKWLGVNEKIAKIVVWILIAMIMLILTNTLLESLGLPFYKITVENIGKMIKSPIFLEYILSWLITLLNFYSIIFLVFRIKEFKKIFPYSILYLIGLIIVMTVLNQYVLGEIYIFVGTLLFIYFYSGKRLKYTLYGVLSFILNTVIQYIWYTYKAKFIDYSNVSQALRSYLVLDYFIIMFVIILAKEIYIKKRGDKNDSKLVLDRNIRQREENSKQDSKEISKKR